MSGNPRLDRLGDYPFVRLERLLQGLARAKAKAPIDAGAGEPRFGLAPFVQKVLEGAIDGFGRYPPTRGERALKEAIAAWIGRRHGVQLDPEQQVLAANGTREALFSVAHALVNPEARPKQLVAMPNPMYQIYLGGAILAGAEPYFLACRKETGFAPELDAPEEVWRRCAFVYVCTPSNPTGWAADLGWWRKLFALSDRFGFAIVSDECYSELYFDAPPLGAFDACRLLGRKPVRLLVMNSLSKRSALPGLRSGFIAGDAALIARFAKLRSYTGPATPPPLQAVAAAAWRDEEHVRRHRAHVQATMEAFFRAWPEACKRPQAGFFVWLPVEDGEAFARRAWTEEAVKLLPGAYLGAEVNGENPGCGYVRVALVDGPDVAEELALRLRRLREGR